MRVEPSHEVTGKILVLMGPSGSGKGTLLSYVRETHPDFLFAVSATTRAKRPGEEDGVNYHFLSNEEFQTAIREGRLLEWAVFAGNYYGTLRSEISSALEAKKVVVLEIEMQGVEQLREQFSPDILHVIYIDAGDWDTLKKRIEARAPISSRELHERQKRFEVESVGRGLAQHIVHNGEGELKAAKQELASIIENIIAN